MDKKTIIAQGHVQSIGQQIQLLICCSFCETIWCHKLPKYKPTLYMHYNISLLASYFVKEMIIILISICNNNPNHDLNHIDSSVWPPRNFSLHQMIKYGERVWYKSILKYDFYILFLHHRSPSTSSFHTTFLQHLTFILRTILRKRTLMYIVISYGGKRYYLNCLKEKRYKAVITFF